MIRRRIRTKSKPEADSIAVHAPRPAFATPTNIRFLSLITQTNGGCTVDSAYNIHGYKGQPVIVATKIMSQNPH